MPEPLLLLPPSEGKAEGGKRRAGRDSFATHLRTSRNQVLEALDTELSTRKGQALERLLGARGNLLQDSLAANRALCDGSSLLLPAYLRYTGVVWEHLDPLGLDAEQLGRILVPSAPYGLNRATDPVADFRLGMAVSIGELGVVSTFWRPLLTKLLSRVAQGRTVIDLLPAEHAAAIDFDELGRRVEIRRVRFLTPDGAKAAGHGAKAVKGILARRLVERGTQRMGSFAWEGWRAAKVGEDLEVYAPPTAPR